MADRRRLAALALVAALAGCTGAPGAAPPPAPTGVSPTPVPTTTAPGGFTATVAPVGASTAARMSASWHPGCPVELADLRLVTLTYRGFDGADHTGEIVVAASVAEDVAEAFRRLYEAGFPLRSVRLVDDVGGTDEASMAADNTSGYLCRSRTGGSGWSEHAFGTAVDVNPRENPYVAGDVVLPPAGAAYLDRPDSPGVIHPDDAAVRAFAAIGWSWGGTWADPVDYQHFSLSGR